MCVDACEYALWCMMVRRDASLLTLWFFKIQNISVNWYTHWCLIDISTGAYRFSINKHYTFFTKPWEMQLCLVSEWTVNSGEGQSLYGFFVLTVMTHFLGNYFFLLNNFCKNKNTIVCITLPYNCMTKTHIVNTAAVSNRAVYTCFSHLNYNSFFSICLLCIFWEGIWTL